MPKRELCPPQSTIAPKLGKVDVGLEESAGEFMLRWVCAETFAIGFGFIDQRYYSVTLKIGHSKIVAVHGFDSKNRMSLNFSSC